MSSANSITLFGWNFTNALNIVEFLTGKKVKTVSYHKNRDIIVKNINKLLLDKNYNYLQFDILISRSESNEDWIIPFLYFGAARYNKVTNSDFGIINFNCETLLKLIAKGKEFEKNNPQIVAPQLINIVIADN